MSRNDHFRCNVAIDKSQVAGAVAVTYSLRCCLFIYFVAFSSLQVVFLYTIIITVRNVQMKVHLLNC